MIKTKVLLTTGDYIYVQESVDEVTQRLQSSAGNWFIILKLNSGDPVYLKHDCVAYFTKVNYES